jgi:SAM-dependent methyltransferase
MLSNEFPYDKEYFESTGYVNYDGAIYRIRQFITYFLFGLYYKYGLKAKTILDIGCATGMSVWVFRKIFRMEAYGVDISQYAVENSIESVRDYIMWGDVSTANFSAQIKRFDLVVSFDAIEHIQPSMLNTAINNIFSLADTAVLGIYVLDEFSAIRQNLIGHIHMSHFCERSSSWWLDTFSSYNWVPTQLPMSRKGTFLIRRRP